MSAPIDVLAVMAHATATFKSLNKKARCPQDYVLDIEDSEAAIAAFAELIGECDELLITPHGHVDVVLQERIASIRAALARVKGHAA